MSRPWTTDAGRVAVYLLSAFEPDFGPMITIGANDDEAQGWLRHARERVVACMDLAAR